MDINGFLKKKIIFERIIEFPKTPVIIFEPMLNCYENNSYAKKLGINYMPNGIVVQDNNYEAWLDLSSKIKITDLDKVNQIIKDIRLYDDEAKECLNKIIGEDVSFYNLANLKDVILQLNIITSNIYNRFVFFTDELFEITNKKKIQELQRVRMELDDLVTNYLFKAFGKIIKTLEEEFKIDTKVIESATTREIIKLLDKGNNLKLEEISNRPIAFLFIKGDKIIFTGDEVFKIKDYLISQNPERLVIQQFKEGGFIKGGIGNKGRVKGIVRKLLVSEYYNKIKLNKLRQEKDYVLITPMTMPELVPFIRNAVAFVTDEGGITCHAAIVARELKKPCIIGTKIATRVLKDGDMVEVDADKGMVKILK